MELKLRAFFNCIAFGAIELFADPPGTAFLGEHPGAELPGWVVADVAGMATGEVGDPVAFFVLVKACNDVPHISTSSLAPAEVR